MSHKIIACFGITALGLALALLLLPVLQGREAPIPTAPAATQSPTEAPEEVSFDASTTLRVLVDEQVQELSLQEYLTGVLLAEMPADFQPEALKAQACASRTFALRQAQAKKHTNADICANASCCQGWKSEADYLAGGGTTEQVEKIKAAVSGTDGLAVTYEDKLIDATYFSCSGGRTEAAVAVWGGDIPYLQSVPSPGEESALRYTDTVEISAEEFSAKVLAEFPEAQLTGTPEQWFGAVTYTAGGGVKTMEIGGVQITGSKLRSLFSLRSTDMTLTPGTDTITITTMGFGHRVGLSQYGAEAMAEAGNSFEAILTHYYQGTEIKKLSLSAELTG